MRKTLILLVASTALTAVIGAFAWSTVHSPAGANERPFAAISHEGLQALPLMLASDDDDDDDDRGHRRMQRRHDGDHDDEDDDDDDVDDDDDDGASGGRNAAPAGSVAPPQNGLFRNGAPPQVKVN